MLRWLKNLFSEPEKSYTSLDKKPAVQFGGGPDKSRFIEVWDSAWSEALAVNDHLSTIEPEVLQRIESILKQGVSCGKGSQKMATELRPIFESVGLKRKDALNLAATITNLSYQHMQKPRPSARQIKYIMGIRIVRGMYGPEDSSCPICIKYGGKKCKSYFKTDFKGMEYESFLLKITPPYHSDCTCGVEEIYEDVLQFLNNSKNGTKERSYRVITPEEIQLLKSKN